MRASFLIFIVWLGISFFLLSYIFHTNYENSIKENNQKILNDLKLIKQNFDLLLSENKKLPKPSYIVKEYSWFVKWFYCKVKEPYHNKCYSYVLSKDWKTYQIWAVLKDKNWRFSILTGNIKNSITMDFLSDYYVKNFSRYYFPYNPYTKYMAAKITNCEWEIYILSQNIKLNETNCKNFNLKPETTIKVWQNSSATIEWENGDKVKILGEAIFKVKPKEIEDKKKPSLFVLFGDFLFNNFKSNIQTPSWTLWIRWDILWVKAFINWNNYFLKIKWKKFKENLKYKIKQKNFNSQTDFRADLLKPKNIDIENRLILDK